MQVSFVPALPLSLDGSHANPSALRKRHLRCDQATPTCSNCQKAERHCHYEIAASSAPKFRRFQEIIVADSYAPRPNPGPAEQWETSLEYFYRRGLPILKSCRPSPLWDHLVTRLYLRESGLREIATALGQQQRIVDRNFACDSAVDEAAALRNKALRSLSKSIQITQDEDRFHTDDAEAYILSCLLMCILESLRGVSADLLVHIRCGIAIVHQQQHMSRETREAAQLLRQYAAGVSLFNTYSVHGLDIQSKLILQPLKSDDELTEPTEYSIANELDALILGTLHLMTECWRLSTTEDSSEDFIELANLRSQLLQRQSRLIECLDFKTRCAQEDNTQQARFFILSKASCILVNVYLEATRTARQTNYDNHMAEFSQVVDLVDLALKQMHNVGTTSGIAPARRAFSVGLPFQALLCLVSTQCRDHDIRWRAFSLLDFCPRHEGAYDLELVKVICRAVIKFEESGIESAEYFIPESRRVHYYHLPSCSTTTGRTFTLDMCYGSANEGEFNIHEETLELEPAP